ncbi:hypothetical protein ACLOJK_020414 [Asimina triloba]
MLIDSGDNVLVHYWATQLARYSHLSGLGKPKSIVDRAPNTTAIYQSPERTKLRDEQEKVATEMAAAESDAGGIRKRACVTGASGYVGSMLAKCLLENGYAVNATVRDPG